jgi:hypothetical protein
VTISESDPRLDRELYQLAEVDDRDDSVRCPLCGHSLDREALRTPTVPPEVLVDGSLDLVARAYVCRRHRVDVVALEPASIAPDTFVGVDAVVDDQEARIAVPEPLAEREGLA